MFCVIYSFLVKPGHEAAFVKAWKDMTLLIREYEGGLGSRLHKKSGHHYIAYAQWPDKATWENSGAKLPQHSNEIRKVMRGSCEKTETLFELDMVEDLLEK